MSELDELREKLDSLQKEWDTAKINLLWPTLIRPGTLRFGGNVMQLDRHGIQIEADGNPSISFVQTLSPNPADADPRGIVASLVTDTAAQVQIGATVPAALTTLAVSSHMLDADSVSAALVALWETSQLVQFSLVADASDTYAELTGGPLRLYVAASDHSSLAVDGSVQYRSDTDKLRLRANGATVNVATEPYADAAVTTHTGDTSDAHDASAISVDSTNLVGVATDVQASLEELDNGIADHLADTSDAHDASAISVLDSGARFTGTDVETVLAEIFDAIPAGGGGMSLIVKEADQTSTSATLADDNELLFAVAANEVFQFEGVLSIDAPAAADFKISFTGPVGAVGSFSAIYGDTVTGTIDAGSGALAASVTLQSTVVGTMVRFWGGIHNGATGGNLTLQWAQGTASGTNTVRAGSYLKFQLES